MRRLRHKEIRSRAQGHVASKWRSRTWILKLDFQGITTFYCLKRTNYNKVFSKVNLERYVKSHTNWKTDLQSHQTTLKNQYYLLESSGLRMNGGFPRTPRTSTHQTSPKGNGKSHLSPQRSLSGALYGYAIRYTSSSHSLSVSPEMWLMRLRNWILNLNLIRIYILKLMQCKTFSDKHKSFRRTTFPVTPLYPIRHCL